MVTRVVTSRYMVVEKFKNKIKSFKNVVEQ